MSNSVLIDRDYLQELVDCADIPDVDRVYQVEECLDCGWRETTSGDRDLSNVEKHNAGCAKQEAILAAMKALES